MITPAVSTPSLWDIPLALAVVVLVYMVSYLFIGNKFGQNPNALWDGRFVPVPCTVDAFDAIKKGWLMPCEDESVLEYGILTVALTNKGYLALELDEHMMPALRKFMRMLGED